MSSRITEIPAAPTHYRPGDNKTGDDGVNLHHFLPVLLLTGPCNEVAVRDVQQMWQGKGFFTAHPGLIRGGVGSRTDMTKIPVTTTARIKPAKNPDA